VSSSHGEHPLRDVQLVDRHVCGGRGREAVPVQCHREPSLCEEEGRLGAQVDQRRPGHFRRESNRVRCRRRHLLLWFIRLHFLAEEARTNAWPGVQQ